MSFRQFLNYLSTADDRRLNAHWRRQTYVLDDVDLDALVRVESLSTEVAAISQRLGLDYDPSILSKRQDNDRQAREQTETIYLEDFERLPYQKIRE